MKTRFQLLEAGMFPETLPPCFTSASVKRSFSGLVRQLDTSWYRERRTEYSRYNGTKHDGSRRFFATPNIITYFHISSFIWRHWSDFEANFSLSKYSIGAPHVMNEGSERAVKVPSLSELSKHTSEKIRYAPFILKADIAQCFPSLYTHSISWAVHGIEGSKRDTDRRSTKNYFNALDFFVQSGQRGNTRGVLIGPDGYRLIAELVLSKIDQLLENEVGNIIVGAVRHVDDYYIGLHSEHDAQAVLSKLRDVLASYELYLNDAKTKIYSSLEPINDLWAQRLRDHTAFYGSVEKIERAISEAVATSQAVGSDSPIKILIRSFDELKLYSSHLWGYVEQNLQRIVQKHSHALDYACLLVLKRHALGLPIDREGWLSVAKIIIKRSQALAHDHEAIWMVWLLLVCKIELSTEIVDDLSKSRDPHMRALLIEAYVKGYLKSKPKLSLGNSLPTMDGNWLVSITARSRGYSKATFSGDYATEFKHLADRNVRLINLEAHTKLVKEVNKRAISRTRYGYDDPESEDQFCDGDNDYDSWAD